MQSESLEEKQKFLRSQIIGKEIDPQQFMQFMGKIKSEGDNIDLDNWSMKQLTGVVERYKQYVDKSKQQLLNSRISKDLRKTKIFDTGKKQKFKYQNTSLWDYEQNYQQQCSKSELLLDPPKNGSRKIQIQKFELKSVGGFLFGIGSRNQLQFVISTNFTPNKVTRKAEDCDWLKNILTFRHSGSFVPPLEKWHQLAIDDKKGTNSKIVEITRFLNSLLEYPVFTYSSYFKEFLTQPNYKKFNEYRNRQSQYARQKDILEIESPNGYFNVNIGQKINQNIKKTSQVTQQLATLYLSLGNHINQLLIDLDNVSRNTKYINQIFGKIGQKFTQVQTYFNLKETKLATIFVTINSSSSIILKNLRLHSKAIYDFTESYIKRSTKDWNQFVQFDKRHQNQFKSYLNLKQTLLKKKEKNISDPTKWQIPQAQLIKIQKQGIGKLNRQQIFEKMFPVDNQRESQTRIWLSFANQNYQQSFMQFLQFQQRLIKEQYQNYSQKYLSLSAETRQSYLNTRLIVGN